MGFPIAYIDTLAHDAHEAGKFIVEDSADALGATVGGRHVGSFGDAGTLSFFPAHQVCAGEGCSVFSTSAEIVSIIESYRNWGRDCTCLPGQDNTCGKRFTHKWAGLPEGYDHKYVFTRFGYNMKMTELQAALGLSQINRLHEFVQKRKENFLYLLNELSSFTEDHLQLMNLIDVIEASPFGFPITVTSKKFSKNQLVNYLEDKKIRTRPVFAGNIVRHPMFRNGNYETLGKLEGSDFIMNNTFWIGCYPGLTDKHLMYVIETIYKFFQDRGLL
jgi:CDP-6-deoxy-D-xylo-4-hexulose-3-dehydrase